MSQALGGLLSPALAELFVSFPFSLFLPLDLDFVIFSSKFSTKIVLTATLPTLAGNDLPFPECLNKKRAKLDSESTKRRHDKRDVDFTAETGIDMSINRLMMTKYLGLQPELSLPG